MQRVEPYVALLRAANRRGFRPRDAPRLQRLLAARLRAPLNLRVSVRWLEATVFRRINLASAAAELRELAGGALLEAREGEPEPPPGLPLAAAYRTLMMDNRFWEAHVAGEAMWRRIGVPGRVLAVLAGAYARAQEGCPASGERMISRALSWLPRGAPRLEQEQLLVELRRVYSWGWGWPLPVLEPLVAYAEALLGLRGPGDGAPHHPVEQQPLLEHHVAAPRAPEHE